MGSLQDKVAPVTGMVREEIAYGTGSELQIDGGLLAGSAAPLSAGSDASR